MRAWGDAVERWAAAGVRRFRQRGRAALAWMVRATAAAVTSYVTARLILPNTDPLLAPLTALLVVQLTPVSLLTSGIQRVISVVAGVSVAVAFSALAGLSWWSLGILIAASIMIGQVLRLGPNILEVPISAMLVMGVGAGAGAAAWQRVAETLVGAGVGVLSNLLFPPRVATRDAGAALQGLAHELAELLDRAADEVDSNRTDGTLVEPTKTWLGESRRLTHDIPNVGAAVLRAEESRRLNLRALGTPDTGPGLRHAMEAVEHSAVAVRSMFRSFHDAAAAMAAQSQEFPEDLRAALATLLHELAAGVHAFGGLVRTEADPRNRSADVTELRSALDGLQEARARVTDLLLVDPRDNPALAQLTLALLTTVERLMQELALDEWIRRHTRQERTLPRLRRQTTKEPGSA